MIEECMKEVPTEMEKDELYAIINKIKEIIPRSNVFVEVGVKTGGSLNIWKHLISPNGLLIGIDTGSVETLKINLSEDKRIKYICGNTLYYKTYIDFLNILNGKEIDCLFIDAGHDYSETKSDFYTYGWNVRKGGLILFHDIYLDNENDRGSTKQFWEEIECKNGKFWEIVGRIDLHTGTGIVKKIC